MSETEPQPQWQSQSQSRSQARQWPQSPASASAAVSMRDLLASCAAATVISTPPRAPEPEGRRPVREHREAA